MKTDNGFYLIRIVRTGVIYFVIVFAAGFVLGIVRVLLIAPLLGVRAAELAEMPVMLTISFAAAHWLIGSFKITYTITARLVVGTIALVLMLIVEFGFMLWLQKLTITQYLDSRDPVSGTAYFLSLVLFALFPLIVRRQI